MRVLMVGVDKKSVGGMLTVVNNFLNDERYCSETNPIYISTVSRKGVIFKILKFVFVLPILFFTILFRRIDIVHVHMAERGSVFREGFVVWLAKFLRRKAVIHLHAAEIEKWFNSLTEKNKSKVRSKFVKADRILILGERWRPFMLQLVGEENAHKIRVLYNAVTVSDNPKYNIESHNFLFYGMLIKRKGIDDLLMAFEKAKNRIPAEVKLMIYGDDAEKRINGLLEKYNSDGRIEFGGWLTPDNREYAFNNAMCHVLPSYNEGLPMSILETMAFGIPNITTNIAAIPEAVADGIDGYLIYPGDVDALAESMIRIANDSSIRRRFSNNSFNKAKERFSIDVQIDELLEIYNDLLGNK